LQEYSDIIVTPTGPQEVQCRTFDFVTATEIPVLIGYLTCDYSFTVFGGRVINKGRSVLLLRRGFNVSVMVGQWSINAGMDDIIDQRFTPEECRELRAFDEVVDETGIEPGMITSFTCIGQRNQPNPDRVVQSFSQTLFWAEAQPIDRIALCYEHTGAIWVPIKVILRDGVVPGFWEGMKILCSAVGERYSK
jgi:hypothetical protein